MFRTFRRKWWRSYLTLARAWARLTTWRHLEERDWLGKLSTNRLLLSLWLFGAALYTANAFFIPDSNCGSGVAETAARYSVKEDVHQTGSVGETPPARTSSRPAEVGTAASDSRPTPGAEVSLEGGAHTLPSVWGIRVIDPETLREGWISGNYLTPMETPQVQAGLPQEPTQPAPEASAVSERPELSQPAPEASAVSEQPEPWVTPRDLRKQRAWKWRHAPRRAFRYERGFYPTR